MNSTTGEFCDARKSLTGELYCRGTQSSAKRKPYFPRKVMNIRPLNLNGIKKELEEGLEEEESQSVFVNCERRALEIPKIKVTEVAENDTTKLKQTCEKDILKDISNNIETHRNNTEIESTDKILIENVNNRTNVQLNVNVIPSIISEVKKDDLICDQKSDSFDFDFSVLSLSTPIKKREINYVTPSANNLKVVKPESTKEQFGEFVTPKVNNIVYKTQCSVAKQSSLRTPINSYKNVLSKTPSMGFTNNINKRPSESSPMMIAEEELKTQQKQASPTSNPRDDKFNRIRVKNVDYIILNMLGKGGSSEVFQCYNVNSQRDVAIKCVSLQNSLSASSYINEVKLLQQLQKCDKIITMYDYEILESQKKLLVVLEKGGKDLSTILKQLASQRSHIPIYKLLFYWMEMLYAVKQIHSHGVIHSDLKPSNFLKADGGLKLIDFGIASSVQNDMTSVIKTTPEGSCNYISPEALNNDSSTNAGSQNSNNPRYKLHYKSDVWSLGCILYQLVYRRTPFQHISQLWPKLATIMNPKHKIDYPDAQWVSPKIINTIKKCLQYNIKLRPSVDELIAEYETILHSI